MREREGESRAGTAAELRPETRPSWAPLACGAAEAVALVAAFLGFGLGWAAVESGAREPAYPPTVAPQPEIPPPVWLVDGYNVLCAGVLGIRDRTRWWSQANRSQLLELAERFDGHAAEVWVVFDGHRSPEEAPTGRVRVVFAAPADDWLLEQVKARAGDAEVALVTADRQLADRARHRGATVVEPRQFVRRCLG